MCASRAQDALGMAGFSFCGSHMSFPRGLFFNTIWSTSQHHLHRNFIADPNTILFFSQNVCHSELRFFNYISICFQSKSTSRLYILKGSRICHPKICFSGILIILSYRHLKNSKRRDWLSLNSLYLPQYPPKGTQLSCISSLEISLTLVIREETTRQHHTQTNFATNDHNLLSVLLRAHSSPLKIIYCLLRTTSLFPFPTKMLFIPEF